MVALAKASAYAAWAAAAIVAALARPANADIFDRGPAEAPSRAEAFNEAYSFADEGGPVGPQVGPGDGPAADTVIAPDQGLDEAALLVGRWAWEGTIEGVAAYMETAFYPDGTYESYAVTPVLELYEAGTWSLADGVLHAEVTAFHPQVVQTPYGPQPIPVEPAYDTVVSFVDADTVRTELGLSYRIE